MKLGYLPHGLLVESLSRRSLVEIQVSPENLIRPFPRKDHLDAHGLYHSGQQIHRGRSPDGRDVIGFDMVDDVLQGVQPFLDRVMDFVMDGSYVFGDHPRLRQIRSPFKSDSERMEPRPPRPAPGIVLDPHLTVLLGQGGDYRRIQSSGKKHPVRDVGHHLAANSVREAFPQSEGGRVIVLHRIEFHPIPPVITLESRIGAPVIMPRRKHFVTGALALQGFEFTRDVYLPVGIVSYIKRYDSYRVPGDEESVLPFIVQDKGEYPAQVLKEERSLLQVQGKDHLAIASS